MFLSCFAFSHPAEEVRVGIIEISQRILDNPFRHPAQPGQIGMFPCSQFPLEIYPRDGFSAFFVDFLLASEAIVVGKPCCSCTLTEQDLLFHAWIKLRLVSSGIVVLITCPSVLGWRHVHRELFRLGHGFAVKGLGR